MVSKCIKSPKYSFKSNLFFSYGRGSLKLRIFLRSKWLLDLPDLEMFLSILDFFNGKKIIFCQNTYFCLKMIFGPCYFYYFFPHFVSGWVGFEKCGKFCTFFKPSLNHSLSYGPINEKAILFHLIM